MPESPFNGQIYNKEEMNFCVHKNVHIFGDIQVND